MLSLPGELGLEPGTELEHRRQVPADDDLARGGLQDAGDALEQGRLARAVAADDAEGLACLNVELQVPKRPEVFVGHMSRMQEALLQGGVLLLVEAEPLRDVLDVDRSLQLAQSSSAKLPSTRPKITMAIKKSPMETSKMIREHGEVPVLAICGDRDRDGHAGPRSP